MTWRWHEPGPMVAFWRCPAGSTPEPFTGEEEQALVFYFDTGHKTARIDGSGNLILTLVPLYGASDNSPAGDLAGLVAPQPNSTLCMQLVEMSGEASAHWVARGFNQIHQQQQADLAGCSAVVRPHITHNTSSLAGLGRFLGNAAEDCYSASAKAAIAVGARSGPQATVVFSCCGRGVALYRLLPVVSGDDSDSVSGGEAASMSDDEHVGADNAIKVPASAEVASSAEVALGLSGEAALLDAAWQQSMPFIGMFVNGEVGPGPRNACLGVSQPNQPSYDQSWTSMFATWWCA
eukprot:gene10508-10668_t